MQAFSVLDVCSRSSKVCICYEIAVSVWRNVTIIGRWKDYLNHEVVWSFEIQKIDQQRKVAIQVGLLGLPRLI